MDPYEDLSISPVDKRKAGKDKGNENPAAGGNGGGQGPSGKPEKGEEADPFEPLTEQLASLRSLLMKSAVVLALWFITIFFTVEWWFPYVSKGYEIVVMGPFEVIRFYVRTSAAIALGLSVPFMLYFIWQYVRKTVGTEGKEVKFLKGSVPVMVTLFLGGLAFGYFVVHPISYFFLIQMGQVNFDVLVTADEYMSFLLVSTIPMGLIFQLPVVVLFLNHIELLDADAMVRFRKYSYFGLVVITALIAPPDFFSHIIILSPMIVLYEISIYLMKRKEKKEAEKEGLV